MKFNQWALSIGAVAALTACGGNSNGPSLNVQLTGLENLGATSVYEGWLIVNGAPKSAVNQASKVNPKGTVTIVR